MQDLSDRTEHKLPVAFVTLPGQTARTVWRVYVWRQATHLDGRGIRYYWQAETPDGECGLSWSDIYGDAGHKSADEALMAGMYWTPNLTPVQAQMLAPVARRGWR